MSIRPGQKVFRERGTECALEAYLNYFTDAIFPILTAECVFDPGLFLLLSELGTLGCNYYATALKPIGLFCLNFVVLDSKLCILNGNSCITNQDESWPHIEAKRQKIQHSVNELNTKETNYTHFNTTLSTFHLPNKVLVGYLL